MDPPLLVGDIIEKTSGAGQQVQFPSPAASSTGFPQHKRRWKSPAVKLQSSAAIPRPGPTPGSDTVDDPSRVAAQPSAMHQDVLQNAERMRIDEENRRKIESMTPQEISQAQDDILNSLNPTLIQRLLRRAKIDEPASSTALDSSPVQLSASSPTSSGNVETDLRERVTPPEAHKHATPPRVTSEVEVSGYNEDKAPAQIPPDLFPIVDLPRSTHFPVPARLPDLDPSDANFLERLHEKYFPDLPADPSQLAWMAPIPSSDSPADQESPYYPHPEINASALRFDFRGRFLPPRVSRAISSTYGLHHHGEAPEAAGYTVAELARLARSAFPAQRCMAFQTLGRILYRLGQGEWGRSEEDPIRTAVWSSVKQGRVLETLMEAASGEGGHRGSRAYATEALWLFDKGGWKESLSGR